MRNQQKTPKQQIAIVATRLLSVASFIAIVLVPVRWLQPSMLLFIGAVLLFIASLLLLRRLDSSSRDREES